MLPSPSVSSGLFMKASELSVLCGGDITVFVRSPSNKVYAFGSPSAKAVINRYDTVNSFLREGNAHAKVDCNKKMYFETVGKSKAEQRRAKRIKEKPKGRGFW
ncbi:hypothetical protein RJ639_039054 [Escallonia herrerae]|uniref:MADS-box domain-containing protein n=1 Tax=Escallonia herrerae TaxID=1293975 RepID=A0AA88WKI2_9ASTE|nr:hypothetical protein RJ639_039054 [Escallonia herrerae]